jgi:hypothetical protein
MSSPVPVVKTEGFSPKMIAATVVSALIGVVIATLNALQENPSLLGGLPLWAQSLALLLIPPVAAGLAAFQASPGSVTISNNGS